MERIGSYSILSIPLTNWLVVLFVFAVLFGSYFFIISQEVNNPPTSDTFVAKVSKLWIEEHESETGGVRVYRVRLERDEDEVTCTIPTIRVGVWQQLETGIHYEFAVSQTVRGCYINEAVKLERQDIFFDN